MRENSSGEEVYSSWRERGGESQGEKSWGMEEGEGEEGGEEEIE